MEQLGRGCGQMDRRQEEMGKLEAGNSLQDTVSPQTCASAHLPVTANPAQLFAHVPTGRKYPVPRVRHSLHATSPALILAHPSFASFTARHFTSAYSCTPIIRATIAITRTSHSLDYAAHAATINRSPHFTIRNRYSNHVHLNVPHTISACLRATSNTHTTRTPRPSPAHAISERSTQRYAGKCQRRSDVIARTP